MRPRSDSLLVGVSYFQFKTSEGDLTMNREILEREFTDSQVKTKKGTFGNQVSYIEGSAIIGRLNEAFDGKWSFEIIEHKILDDEVVVLGKLIAEGITKTQFGNSRITRNRDSGEPVSIGDDLKAASTDAIKKCSTLLGVGLYLYGGNSNDHELTKSNGNSNQRKDTTGNGNGNSNGRLTNSQLQAIYNIGQSKQMSQKEIKDFCLEIFNKVLYYLSREEASTIIQE